MSNLKRLILLQKQIVRTIEKADYLASSQPIFKKLEILKVTEIIFFTERHFYVFVL